MRMARPSIRAVKSRQLKSGPSYVVSWRVPKLGEYSRSFRAKAAAEQLQRRLKTAADNPATRWDPETGLPEELRLATTETWAGYVLEFIERQRELRPSSIRSLYDGIAIATVELLSPRAKLTVANARAIRAYLLDALVPGNGHAAQGPDHDEARRILRMYSRSLSDLNERPVVASLTSALRLEVSDELRLTRSARRTALARRLADQWIQPGTKAVSRNTWLRRRSAVSAVITDAIDHGLLKENPVRSSKRAKKGSGTARAHKPVPLEVASVTQVRLLARVICVLGRGSGRYFALVYLLGLAGLRPSEAYHLRIRDVRLPVKDTEWGSVLVRGGTLTVGRRYTSDGEPWSDESVKTDDDPGSTREVPILPEVVMALRLHLEFFRTGAHYDERVFVNRNGNPINPQNFERLFRAARSEVFPPSSPLYALTPYGLRHSSVSMQMRAGVPVAEIARRHGHSVEVLLSTYSGFLEEDIKASNERIQQLVTGQGGLQPAG